MYKSMIDKAVKQRIKIKVCELSSGHEYKFYRKEWINGHPGYDVHVHKCIHCGICELIPENE